MQSARESSAAIAEEVAGEWLKQLLRLPPTASFALATGCQTAHLTCLAAARQAVLSARGWDVETNGLGGAPPVRVLSSEARHGSMARAVRLLGLGEKHLITCPAMSQEDCSRTYSPLNFRLILTPQRSWCYKPAKSTPHLSIPSQRSSRLRDHGAWVHIDEASFTGTTWKGRRAMRVSVCGWQTSSSDVERAIAAVARALAIRAAADA